MNILIKFPTRGRPEKFFDVLNRYMAGVKVRGKTKFLVTIDTDDQTMNNSAVISKLSSLRDVFYSFGSSKSKIDACNRDLNNYLETADPQPDIILLASDDMIPEERGYDEIIRGKMEELYPDTDGVLWFFDGYRKDFNTLCILGRKYYQRFGYIYHPDYKSFWSDNEFTEVANSLGKQTFIDKVIIRHVHPDWIQRDPATKTLFQQIHPTTTNIGLDETFMKNLPFERQDAAVYLQRKAAGFPR